MDNNTLFEDKVDTSEEGLVDWEFSGEVGGEVPPVSKCFMM